MDYRLIIFVVSCIIGSGIFIIPYNLSQFGYLSVFSILICGGLFTMLGVLFAEEEDIFEMPQKILNPFFSFLLFWVYWIISWTSTIIVLNEIFISLSSLFPILEPYGFLTQSTIVFIFIFLNQFGNKNSIKIEFILTVLKILPLLLVPITAIFMPKVTNISYTPINGIWKAIPTTAWCFIGVECGPIIGKNFKSSSLRLSVLTGMVIVTIIIFSNIISIFNVLGTECSIRPYMDFFFLIFGSWGKKILSILISVLCIGTLNSWIVSSGLTAYDGAKLGFLPKKLLKLNKFNTPFNAILASSLGLIPLCYLTSLNMMKYITTFIDASCVVFLFYYGIISLLIFYKKKKKSALICFVSCFTLIGIGGINNIYTILIVGLSGIIFYPFIRKNLQLNNTV